MKLYTYNDIIKHTMALLLALNPKISSQVPNSRGVSVIYEFTKGTTITAVELELDLRSNIFGTSDDSYELQDNRLKIDQPLGVPLLRSYAVKIHCKY